MKVVGAAVVVLPTANSSQTTSTSSIGRPCVLRIRQQRAGRRWRAGQLVAGRAGAGAGVQGYNTLGSVGSSHRAGGHTAASRQHTQRTQRGSNTDQSRVCTVLVTGSGEVPSTVT